MMNLRDESSLELKKRRNETKINVQTLKNEDPLLKPHTSTNRNYIVHSLKSLFNYFFIFTFFPGLAHMYYICNANSFNTSMIT